MTDDDIRDRHDIESVSEFHDADPEAWDEACTLNEAEVEQRERWIEEHLLPHMQGFGEYEDGVRATFANSAEALAAVTTVLRYEARCCAFATFDLTVPGDGEPIRLDMRGPTDPDELLADGAEFIRKLQATGDPV